MKSEHELLKEKYWNGETTRQEEQRLLQLLQDDTAHLDSEEATYFEWLSEVKDIKANQSDTELMSLIKKQDPSKSVFRRYLPAVAASFLIITGSLWWLASNSPPATKSTMKNTPQTEAAFSLTGDLLFMISRELNKVEAYALHLGAFAETIEKIQAEPKEKQ